MVVHICPPNIGRWRKENQTSKVILGYIERSRPAGARLQPVQKRKKKRKKPKEDINKEITKKIMVV